MGKYIPYKNAEEFLQNLKEHGSIFIKKGSNVYLTVNCFDDKTISYFDCTSDEIHFDKVAFDDFLENAVWADGYPCGIETDAKKRYYSHTYVDLGLPSGTKWGVMNIGAENETDYGLYFAWGETKGYTGITEEKKFIWDDYKYGTESNLTKYNTTDGLTTLEPSDDAATVNWGGKWRMPTVDQFNELLDPSNCTNEWVEDYDGSGVNGRLFTSVRNSKTLFFPAAGRCNDGSLYGTGVGGCFWSCALSSGDEVFAQYPYFYSGGVVLGGRNRVLGLPVRPVFA